MHLCFLDIDGTLVLTGGAGQAAFAMTLAEEFAITEHTSDVLFAGRSDRAIAIDLFRAHGIDPSPENWLRFRTEYLKRLDRALPTHQGFVLPGAVPLLEALSRRGDVALGLITGNVREAAERKLTHYGLWHWFDFGGFGDDHIDRNDIAAAAVAAGRRHLEERGHASNRSDSWQMVVVGDTLNDISCGRSIGARCVAVPTGQSSAEILQRGEPDILVNTLEETEPILSLFDGDPSPTRSQRQGLPP